MAMFKDFSIAILIWMVIFFLHGFFKELYRNLKERYEDWENKKKILYKARELVKESLLEWEDEKEGSTRITVEGNKIIIKKGREKGEE